MKRETLLRAYPATPDAVRARMAETLDKLQSPRMRRPVRRWSAALAAALLLGMVGLGAAAGFGFGIFDLMGGPVLMEAQELVQRPAAALTLEHTVITLEEVVYDGGALRAVWSICAKEGPVRQAAAADGLNPDGCDWFVLDGREYTMPSGAYSALYDDEANDRLLCYLDIPTAGFAPEKTFTVELPVADQMLSFAVEPTAASHPPVRAETDAATVTLQSASDSPVRIYAQVQAQRSPESSQAAWIDLCGGWEGAVLADAGGGIIGQPEHMQMVEENESLTVRLNFLPVEAQEVWIAPTTFTENDEWVADMAQAFRIR